MRVGKVNTAEGVSRNDLCALCLLFVHPLVFIPRRLARQRGVQINKMICVLCLYQENALRSLRALRLIFFILGGRRDFYNFPSKNKTEKQGFE
jgi:hypothetical protein